jgi:hypothetical protein
MAHVNSSDTPQQQQQQPIARLLLNAVTKHAAVVGDGSGAFIIALAGCMRAAQAFTQEFDASSASAFATAASSAGAVVTPAASAQSRQRRHQLLRALERVQRHWVLEGALERWLVSRHGTVVPRTDDAAVRLAVLELSRTLMSHQLSPAAVKILSEALVHMLFSARGEDVASPSQLLPLHDVCAAVLNDFPFISCSQLPLSDTRLLNGFLIPAKVALRSMPTSLHDGKLLVLHCTLHAAPLAHEARAAHLVLEARSAEASLAFLTAGEEAVKAWVRRFHSEGIRLILCSYKLHDSALSLLSAAGIAVLHCLDELDTRRVAHYARTHPVSSLGEFEARFDGQRDALLPLPTGQLGAFTQIMVGSQPMAHIELAPDAPRNNLGSSTSAPTSTPLDGGRSTAPLVRPFTLLLCGASDGMCKQYEQMLHRCLRMLQDWSRSSAAFERSGVDESTTISSPSSSSSSSSATDATAAASPASSLYTVGGGGATELSLLLFCDAQARLTPASALAQSPVHPLVPPIDDTAPASSHHRNHFATTAAWTVLSAGLSDVVRSLLSNALPATCEEGAAEDGRGGAKVQWLKMMPHLVSEGTCCCYLCNVRASDTAADFVFSACFVCSAALSVQRKWRAQSWFWSVTLANGHLGSHLLVYVLCTHSDVFCVLRLFCRSYALCPLSTALRPSVPPRCRYLDSSLR